MHKQAEPFFAQAIKLDPDLSGAVFNLGKLYHDQERWDDAIVVFEEWLRVEGEFEETLDETQKRDGRSCAVYNILGGCYVRGGNYDRARELWEKSLEIESDQPEISEALDKLPQPLHRRVSLTLED